MAFRPCASLRHSNPFALGKPLEKSLKQPRPLLESLTGILSTLKSFRGRHHFQGYYVIMGQV